ncbi:hypothetical protein EsH8_V_001164 [Colletotrichum jinshuiense]
MSGNVQQDEEQYWEALDRAMQREAEWEIALNRTEFPGHSLAVEIVGTPVWVAGDQDADNPRCIFADYTGVKRELAPLSGSDLAGNTTAQGSNRSLRISPSLCKKAMPNFDIGNKNYNLTLRNYPPYRDPSSSANALKDLVYNSLKRRCHTDVSMVENRKAKETYLGTSFESDDIYEALTLGIFFEWLIPGTSTIVGTYSLAAEEWVVKVLLGNVLPGQSTGNNYVMDVTQLNVNAAWRPSPVFNAMIFSFDWQGSHVFQRSKWLSHAGNLPKPEEGFLPVREFGLDIFAQREIVVLASAHKRTHEVEKNNWTLELAFCGTVRSRRMPESVVEYDRGPGRTLSRSGKPFSPLSRGLFKDRPLNNLNFF